MEHKQSSLTIETNLVGSLDYSQSISSVVGVYCGRGNYITFYSA